MAASSSTWDEEMASWKRVGELGMEAALREIGCDERLISEALGASNRNQFCLWTIQSDNSHPVFYTELERSTLLATVGRGTTRVDTVSIRDVITENEATALCANLTSNTNVKDLNVGAAALFLRSTMGCTHLGIALAANPVIKSLRFGLMDAGSEGLTCLLNGLQRSKTLESLDLGLSLLEDEGFRVVGEYLAESTTLKRFALEFVRYCLEGAKHLSSGLARNTSLEELCLGVFCEKDIWGADLFSENTRFGDPYEGFKVVMESLSRDVQDSPQSPNGQKNSSFRKLRLSLPRIFTEEDPASVGSLTSMIRLNHTLLELKLDYGFPPQVWKDQIFPALKDNSTLKQLDISGCGGLGGHVFEAILDVLQNSNTALEKIDLAATGLNEKEAQVAEELRINQAYRSSLRRAPIVSTTSGRLVLCGLGFGGKTQICNTIERIDGGTPPPHPLKTGWKKLMQAVPALRRVLFGKDAYLELANRTRGCNISVLENQLPLKSIWDFAGQTEYYALHDYLFPNMANSCFLFVCSCRHSPTPKNPKGAIKNKEDMRKECAYWMKFIASNSKVRIGVGGQGLQLPRVVFALTKKDTLQRKELGISKAAANGVVKVLKTQFDGVVELCEKVHVVDGRSAQDVAELLTVVKEVLGKALENQTEYAVCQKVREVLGIWSAENESKPVLTLDEYYTLCEDQLKIPHPLVPVSEEELRGSRAAIDVALAYLNDLGEIISLQGLDFIVANPRWFGVGVLGSLINAFKGSTTDTTGLLQCCRAVTLNVWDPPYDEGGFVDRETMKVLLEHSLETMRIEQPLTTDQLTDLMIELEMCYKKDPHDEDSQLFLPVLFDNRADGAANGERQLEWKLEQGGPLIHLGRRLSCENESKTFLTPGFFPRWQVRMLNRLQRQGWASNSAFQIGRNVIAFAENGIEVIVEYSGGEYSGDIGYFVDILVRSSQPYVEALKFIETHVVQSIRNFCATPQGCQGVLLEASVIRPECVQELDKCVYRKDQFVLISFLAQKLASDPTYQHIWSTPRPGPRPGRRRQRLGKERETSYALDLLEGEGSFSRRSFKGKSPADHRNLADVASSSASFSSRGDDLPKLIYPSIEDVGTLRNIATRLNLRKKIALKVHLLCDNKDGSHEVVKQPGRTYVLNWKDGGLDLPIAKHLVTLVYSALGVGTTVAGAPFALPSIDSLLELFDAPEMPAIDVETLHEMMNPATALAPVSKESICAVLAKFMESNPHALGLKQFLKLNEVNQFWSDFRLRKVVYTEVPYQNRIGWVCDRCYWKDHEILKDAPQ